MRYEIDEYVDTAVDSILHLAYSNRQIVEPQKMEKAMAGDFSVEWKQAADAEYASLMKMRRGTLWSYQVED